MLINFSVIENALVESCKRWLTIIINYFLEEIKQNELMSKKHHKVCTTLNHIEHFLSLASMITECISVSDFTSLIANPIGITSSTIGLKISGIAPGIKQYKSIIKKEKKKIIK